MTDPGSPWRIERSNPEDQPPEHDPDLPWVVYHPTTVLGRRRKLTRFGSHAAALAFVLADPEVRRRTQLRPSKDPS